jgi:hypothetical protein
MRRRQLTGGPHAKTTALEYRPNAKYPWLIAQRNNEVKLSHAQMIELIQAASDQAGHRRGF